MTAKIKAKKQAMMNYSEAAIKLHKQLRELEKATGGYLLKLYLNEPNKLYKWCISFTRSQYGDEIMDGLLTFWLNAKTDKILPNPSQSPPPELVKQAEEFLLDVKSCETERPETYRLWRESTYQPPDHWTGKELLVSTIHVVTDPMCTETLQDGFYEESTVTYHVASGRVTSTKPRYGRDSVLVALNID